MKVRLEARADPYYKDRTYPAIVEILTGHEVLSPFNRFGSGGSGRSDHRLLPETAAEREAVSRHGLEHMLEPDEPEAEGPPLRGSYS